MNSCGARISGAGGSIIEIEGTELLNGQKWKILSDRIEAGTYLIAAAMTNGHVKVNNISPSTIKIIYQKLSDTGVKLN